MSLDSDVAVLVNSFVELVKAGTLDRSDLEFIAKESARVGPSALIRPEYLPAALQALAEVEREARQ